MAAACQPIDNRCPVATESIMTQLWAHDKDIGNEGVLVAALTKAGFDGDAIVNDAKANIDDYAAAIATDTEQAVAANVFGAPTFIVDGEIFWGQDRLDLLDWHLSNL